MSDLLVTGIGMLVTNEPRLGRGRCGVRHDAALLVHDGRVGWVGDAGSIPSGAGGTALLDLGGRCVLPGFVDAHTHLVFAGDRSGEFSRRMEGASYEEIRAAGGGIMATVRATREASFDDLLGASRPRAERMLAAGTTTVEIKSGYGLEAGCERRMLEVALRIGEDVGIDVVPTFLAHTVPAEWNADREGYLRILLEEMLPACAPLARYVDVFCDRGAFSVDETRRILAAAGRAGLRPRLHAEQLAHTGAADLAAELRAASADHLDHLDAGQARRLAAAGTVAVLLPGAMLSLQTAPPPLALLRDAGVTVALATDCNPGTSYVETMPFVIALAVLVLGMTVEEAVWGATRGGALALDEPDKGLLAPGAVADLVVLDADHPAHLAYRPDTPLVETVIRRGAVLPGVAAR